MDRGLAYIACPLFADGGVPSRFDREMRELARKACDKPSSLFTLRRRSPSCLTNKVGEHVYTLRFPGTQFAATVSNVRRSAKLALKFASARVS